MLSTHPSLYLSGAHIRQRKSDAGKPGKLGSYTRRGRQHGGLGTGTVTLCRALGLIGQAGRTRAKIQVPRGTKTKPVGSQHLAASGWPAPSSPWIARDCPWGTCDRLVTCSVYSGAGSGDKKAERKTNSLT